MTAWSFHEDPHFAPGKDVPHLRNSCAFGPVLQAPYGSMLLLGFGDLALEESRATDRIVTSSGAGEAGTTSPTAKVEPTIPVLSRRSAASTLASRMEWVPGKSELMDLDFMRAEETVRSADHSVRSLDDRPDADQKWLRGPQIAFAAAHPQRQCRQAIPIRVLAPISRASIRGRF